MIFIFFFFSFHKSIRANKIENSNTSIIIIVPTDSQKIYSDICQTVKDFIQKNFSSISFQNISHSEWNEKYGIGASSEKIHFALFRFNKFVEFYPGPFNFDNIHKYLTLSFYSHVIIINEKDVPLISKNKKRFFILRNDHIYYEYENAAFLYKYSKVTFFFIKGSFSLVYYDNVNQITKKYDFSRSMTIFIKSCANFNKKTIKKFYENIEKEKINKIDFLSTENIFKIGKFQRFHLFAITDSNENNNEINSVLHSLKRNYYSNGNFSIINWNNRYSFQLQKNCRIKPNELTYALSYSRNGTDFCYFYPYETVNNIQNFNSFFEKFIHSAFYSDLFISRKVKNKRKMKFESSNNLSKIIPDNESSIFLFISNSKSSSNNKAYEAFYLLKYRLNLLKGIKFMVIESSENNDVFPYFIPSNDDFPLFVMWTKNDRHPHIFQDELTNQNLLNFALKYIEKNRI